MAGSTAGDASDEEGQQWWPNSAQHPSHQATAAALETLQRRL